MRIRLNILLPLLLAMGLLLPFLATANEPSDVVKQGVEVVVDLIQDKSLDAEARREQIRALIDANFDFETMSQSILALSWKQASDEQRQRFIALFKQLLENTYITAIESYSSEQILFGSEKIKGNKAIVPVRIRLKSGAEAPLMFKLKKHANNWGVYDVMIEGVSLVNNYRTSFHKIMKSQGIDGLLSRLEEKVASRTQSS